MLPNGIAHQLATDDQDGVQKILRWLSYVPKTASEQVAIAAASDPIERDIAYTPPNTPYDPRHMIAGTTTDLPQSARYSVKDPTSKKPASNEPSAARASGASRWA